MNKSKKTPLLLVIALIICMGLTAGLTMAFFGGTSTGSSTVTLKTGVKVGATATASNDGAMVVPGQPIDISATGTVEPYSSTGTVVPALLRLKFTIGGAMDVTPTLNTTDAMTIKTEAGDATGYWVLNESDGYYYLCAEAAEATVANTQLLKFTPVNTTTEEDKTKVSLTGNFVVPTSLGNEASNQSLDINARFEVIQAEIYANGSDTAIADENLTIGNEAVQEVFGEFAPEETPVYLNQVSGDETLSSVEFEDNTATISVTSELQAGNQAAICLDVLGLTSDKIALIDFTTTEIANASYSDYIFNGHVDMASDTSEAAIVAIYQNQFISSVTMDKEAATSTKIKLTKDSNHLDVLISYASDADDLSGQSITTTITITILDDYIPTDIEYNTLVSASENEGTGLMITAEDTVRYVEESSGAQYSFYNYKLNNIPDTTGSVFAEVTIDMEKFNKSLTTAGYDSSIIETMLLINSCTTTSFATILFNELGMVAEISDTSYGPFQGVLNTKNPYFTVAIQMNELINIELPINVKYIGESSNGVLVPTFENNVAEEKYWPEAVGTTTTIYGAIPVTMPELDAPKQLTIEAPYWFVLEGHHDSQFASELVMDGGDSSELWPGYASSIVSGGEEFTIFVVSTTSVTFGIIDITFTLTDAVVNSINFADINTTQGATLSYNDKSWDGQYGMFLVHELYNFTITGIETDCTIEVSYTETNNPENINLEYFVYMKDSHYLKPEKVGTNVYYSKSLTGDAVTTSNLTFNLKAGEEFDFGVCVLGDESPRHENITLTFKVLDE